MNPARPSGQCAVLPALRHRVSALDVFLRELPADRGLEERARIIALEQFRSIVTETSRECDRIAQSTDDAEALLDELTPLLNHFTSVSRIAHETFARGSRGVPTILVRAVQRELELLDLDVYPMLRVGPPNDFVTDTTPLWQSIYDDDHFPELAPPVHHLYLFGVPPVEGMRALWFPITVGHEVAHVLNEQRQLITDALISEWVSPADLVEESTILDAESLRDLGETLDERVFQIRSVLLDWAREIFCDLYAVLRFGPAALAAQAELLASVAASDDYESSHPPSGVRVDFMAAVIDKPSDCYAELWSLWETWRLVGRQAEHSSIVDYLVKILQDHLQVVRQLAQGACPRIYDVSRRANVVSELADWLEVGVPRSEVQTSHDVVREDVLNAGWVAYYRRAHSSSSGPSLEQVDALTAKALDDLDFLELMAFDAPPHIEASNGVEPLRLWPSSAAVMSASEAIRALNHGLRSGPGAPSLVVTPSQGSLRAAGATLDLRVGKGFIVFRRSSTTSFDATSAHENPRELQEYIERDWGEEFVLHPGELVLAASLEYLRVPNEMTGQVITRSSYGRLGLITATAVQVQPGYTGCLTLELVNLGQVPMTLTPGERIAQLLLMRLQSGSEVEHSKYRYPVGPEFSRVSADPDLMRLKLSKAARGL